MARHIDNAWELVSNKQREHITTLEAERDALAEQYYDAWAENAELRAEVEWLKVEDGQRFDKWRAAKEEVERLREALKPLVRERGKLLGKEYYVWSFKSANPEQVYGINVTKAELDKASEPVGGSEG